MSAIAANLARIQDRMAAALDRAGRNDAVELVGVTKYATLEQASQLVEAGCEILGESRPQQLWERCDTLVRFPVRWHLIGHLQRNKIKRTLPLVELIHSVDSTKLARAINAQGESLSLRTTILLEVNISGDEEKHGFAPIEVEEALAVIGEEMPHVSVNGLMGMASYHRRGEAARSDFRALKQLYDELAARHRFTCLSMGMSGDFEVAIEEGSTLIRVGSALFTD